MLALANITIGVMSAILIITVSIYYLLGVQKIEKCNEMLNLLKTNEESIRKEIELYQREWFPTPSYTQQINGMKEDFKKQVETYETECN